GTGVAGFTGPGPALSVQLKYPSGLAFDQSGNLFISDTGNERMLELKGGVLMNIAGNGQEGFAGDGGSAQGATLHRPWGIVVSSSGVIYFADRDNFRLRKIDSQGVISSIAGNGQLLSSQNNQPASLATLLDPFGVSVDSRGALLVADTDNNILRK